MKRTLMTFMLALVMTAVTLLPGCKGFRPDEETPNNPATTITIAVPASAGSVEKDVMENLAKAYKTANPDCTLDFYVQEINGGYDSEMTQLASAGVLPDIFLTGDSNAYLFANYGMTEKLETYAEKNAEYKAILQDIYPSLLEMYAFNGGTYGLPREYPRMLIFYNKTLFDDANIAYPQNGWTWEQFRQTATKLTKVDSDGTVLQYGSSLRIRWTSAIIPVLLGLDPEAKFISDDGKSGAIDEHMLTGLSELRSMVLAGECFNEYSPDNATFANGSIAMYVSISGDVPNFEKTLGKGKFDVVSMPETPKGSIGTGTSGYSVSKSSAHKDTAVDFLFFMASEEGQNILGRERGIIPVRKSMATTGEYRTQYQGYNLEAFLYKTEYDAPTLTSMLYDKSKTSPVMEGIMAMIENYVAKTVDVSDPAKLIENYNKRINNELNIG